jgi:hypothetical protein
MGNAVSPPGKLIERFGDVEIALDLLDPGGGERAIGRADQSAQAIPLPEQGQSATGDVAATDYE